MNLETEKTLDEVKVVHNKTDKRGRLQQKARRYLTFQERKDREQELGLIENMLSPTNIAIGNITPDGRSTLSRRRLALQDQLEEGAPPELSGEQKDALGKRRRELEEKIKVGMLTSEEMRRNPAGAVDRNIRWERANKASILEWKNIQRALNRDDDGRDVANIEMLRPSQMYPKGASTFMVDAQIPGQFTSHQVSDENWEATFGPGSIVNENSPLAQAERRELEELRAMKAEADAKKAEKARVFKERMAKGREKANEASA